MVADAVLSNEESEWDKFSNDRVERGLGDVGQGPNSTGKISHSASGCNSYLCTAFSKLDVNKDGTISKQEFVAGVLKDPENWDGLIFPLTTPSTIAQVQKILHIPIEKTTAKTPESRDAQGVRRGSLKLRDKDVLRRAVRTRKSELCFVISAFS
eukprot:595652-Amorphochlora_amoeboformis.AAC.2